MVFALVLLVGFVSSSILVTPASAESLSSWVPTTPYPFVVSNEACSAYNGYIYCLGGASNGNGLDQIETAQVSSVGVGQWTSSGFYPSGSLDGESCPIYNGYMYCVGGTNTATIYYAPVSSAGVGTLTPTTPYPTPVFNPSCAIFSGYIFCVGGDSTGSGVYYAKVSASGVGAWTQTISYPFAINPNIPDSLSCVANDYYMYCVGGGSSTPYFTNIGSAGVIGNWYPTQATPSLVDSSCTTYLNYIYCVGGSSSADVIYAPLYGDGIGQWLSASSYPFGVEGEACAADAGYIYCVGGLEAGPTSGPTSGVYYSQIDTAPQNSSSVTTSTTTTTVTSTSTSTETSASVSTTTVTSTSVQPPVTTTTTATVTSTQTSTTTITQLLSSVTNLTCDDSTLAQGQGMNCHAATTIAEGGIPGGSITFSSTPGTAGTFSDENCKVQQQNPGYQLYCGVKFQSSATSTTTPVQLEAAYSGDPLESGSVAYFSVSITTGSGGHDVAAASSPALWLSRASSFMTPSLLSASAAIAAVVLVVVGVTIPLAKFKGKNAAKIRPSKEPKANP